MIDLIIPVYNNYSGLILTLQSINFNIFNVTVIDDCSKYRKPLHFPIKFFSLKRNIGPGRVRQYGIDHTSNPYMMFIDAGDIFISKEIQEQIPNTISSNPDTNIFSWSYIYKDKETTHIDNRLHGKVYKRAFLKTHNITFSKAGSYLNEDIGFNRMCRIFSDNIHTPIKYIDTPIIKYIINEGSLTQKNNNQVLYQKQNKALAINSIHCITTCQKNQVHKAFIQREINEVSIALYYWFIRAAAERPEYIEDAWNGAKIFYDRYKKYIDPENIIIGSTYFTKTLLYRDKVNFMINLPRFYIDITMNKFIPGYYLT